MLYFAYGSNLDQQQMRSRCPSATVVGRAWLPSHRLVFKGWSGGWGGAVASIEPAEGCSVEGAVYQIHDENDVLWLDHFEGCPTVYRCERVRVTLGDHETRMRCWTYVKNTGDAGWPSTRYANTVAAGLKSHGHGTTTLATALARIPAQPKPRPLPPLLPRTPAPSWLTTKAPAPMSAPKPGPQKPKTAAPAPQKARIVPDTLEALLARTKKDKKKDKNKKAAEAAAQKQKAQHGKPWSPDELGPTPPATGTSWWMSGTG
jgi:cation transport regulator ChaC